MYNNKRLSYTDSNGVYHSLIYECPTWGDCSKVNSTSSIVTECPTFVGYLKSGKYVDERYEITPVNDIVQRKERFIFLAIGAGLAGFMSITLTILVFFQANGDIVLNQELDSVEANIVYRTLSSILRCCRCTKTEKDKLNKSVKWKMGLILPIILVVSDSFLDWLYFVLMIVNPPNPVVFVPFNIYELMLLFIFTGESNYRSRHVEINADSHWSSIKSSLIV